MIEEAANLLKNIGVVFTEEQLDIIDHGIQVEDAIHCEFERLCEEEESMIIESEES